MIGNGPASPLSLTRRRVLAAGTVGAGTLGALPLGAGLLLSTAARAQIRPGPSNAYLPPRRLADVDHAVVYRREDEMADWPHTMGYWNFGDGELLQQVTAITTSYADANVISHDNLGKEGLGSKQVALRSHDWGRTWGKPVTNMMASIDQRMAAAKRMVDLQPIDFLVPCRHHRQFQPRLRHARWTHAGARLARTAARAGVRRSTCRSMHCIRFRG